MPNRILFAWTVLALAILTLAVVEQDRPWKRIQAESRGRELERLHAELAAERRRTSEALRVLEIELTAARQSFESQRERARRLERELAEARSAVRWAATAWERLRAEAGGAAPFEGELREARRELEERRQRADEIASDLEGLRSELDSVERRRAAEMERTEDLEKEIAELRRGALRRRLPGFRGLDPTLSVIEVAPPGLSEDTPGGRVERLDRCRTCHLETSHPGGLVGEDAPHAPSSFGCTVCHGGNGRATDFTLAGHWPESAEEEAEWAEAWGFTRSRLPRQLILPKAFLEAGCAECHADGPGTQAETVSIDRGRRLISNLGCAGCHSCSPLPLGEGPGTRAPGPPLGRLAAKTTPEWTFHWIASPRRFRPTTSMPHLFSEETDEAEKAAVIESMVAFLFFPPAGAEAESPPEGDSEAGERLFETVGCTGCHLLDAGARRDGVALERLHGPNLAGTGDKVRPVWLYAWLRDPRSHRPDTPMPNLRLTEEEAADLTAFLVGSTGPSLPEVPRVDAAVRDGLVLRYLEGELSLAESAARLERMSRNEKLHYLGRRSLETYGCYGCHDIPGFEDAPPVAAPLGETGREPRLLLAEDDFLSLVHSKLRGPAPDYALSRRESDAVKVSLLALRASSVLPGRRAGQGYETQVLVAGRRLIEQYGCLGCHRIDGRGGSDRSPALSSAGARFQPSWLFEYLGEPDRSVRRPWLGVRMPSFDLSAREKNVLVRYFSARDRRPLFVEASPSPSARDLEVGRAVAAMLRCRSCHADSPEAADLTLAEKAPAYSGAPRRLRPDWVVEWILDPESLIPGTVMPTAFARDERGEPDASFLTATISAPMFTRERQRLLPLFESEDELAAYLEDARRVAVAIRDYLWSLRE